MTTFEVAFKFIVPERRMKVSRFSDLNDPFELTPHDLGDRAVREKLNTFIAQADKQLGLMCFSDNWKSPLMWAHYADNHRGVCLGFDIHEGYLAHVRYQKTKLLHRFGKEMLSVDDDKLIEQMLYYKAEEWGYERELRAIVRLDRSKSQLQHINFGCDLQLREVIIGCRNPLSPRDLEPFIQEQETSVQILKARPAFKAFEMTPNHRYKTITLPAKLDCCRLHGQSRKGPRFISSRMGSP